MLNLFAVCSPGLEPFVLRELQEASFTVEAKPVGKSRSFIKLSAEESGGLNFSGSLRDLYRANVVLRTVTRILVRHGEFPAAAFPELRRKAGRLPWEEYLNADQPVAFRVTCHASRLYHSDAVAERIAAAIEDRLGKAVNVQRFNEGAAIPLPQLIVVRLVNNLCTISVDSSGMSLHRRGYRLAAAKAPMRETLAAGIVMASGWDRQSPLIDPFCGSGTIPIEAALMARNIFPGGSREFAFQYWPNFDVQAWQKIKEEIRHNSAVSDPPVIRASDRDAGAVRAAEANAGRAGVGDCIEFSCRAVSAVEVPSVQGWIVTNPPYGLRVSRKSDLRNLYAQFGNILRARFSQWRLAMLCGDPALPYSTGLNFEEGIPLAHGGLKVRLLKTTIP